MALQRRCPEDDGFVTSHNLYLTMFSPSSINVLPFDPDRNSDQARLYAGKYCSKPEKWFFLQCQQNGLQHWLRCRTVGQCMTHNKLMEFRVVRSTRAVVWTPTRLVEDREHSMRRTPQHLDKHGTDYPDAVWYLHYQGKYLFRALPLRHLRIEQFNHA